MPSSYNEQRLLVFLKNLFVDDVEDVVVPAHQNRLKIWEGIDFGPVYLRVTQPDLNAMCGRQLQIHSSDIGVEIDEAQCKGTWQPADHIGPDVTKLGEGHILA